MTTANVQTRDELVDALVARLTGPDVPRSVLLRGPAGIGKSHTVGRVAERALATATGDVDLSVRRLAGGPAVRSIGFGALLPLLPPDTDPIAVEFELVQRLRAAMVPPGVRRRIVIVDDIGLVDPKSAGLLEALVVNGDVVVLSTERTPLTGAPDEHALSHTLRDHADAIDLPPMTDAELTELVVGWRGPGEVGSVRRIAATSRGNPLVARELLNAAEAAGAVAERDGLWYLDGFHPAGHTIERLVGEHLARLGEGEWELVRCVAAADALPRRVLERIDAAALGRLERTGLLSGVPVSLGHPLYGEVTRAAMTVDETRQVCRKLLETVTPDDDIDAAVLGNWLLTAGDVVDPDLARAGARRALSRWENDLARDLLATIPVPSSADLVLLQWAHANAGRLHDAEGCADRAVTAAATDADRVEAVLARSELLCLQLGRAREGYDELLALRASIDDPALLARVDGATALYSQMTGNRELAGESVERARELDPAATADGPAAVSVRLGEAFGHVFSGRFAAAAPAIAEGRRLAERLGERHNTVRFDVVDALRLLLVGDIEASARLIDATLRSADVSGVRPAHVVWLGLASQLAQIEGRYGVAEQRAREAVRAAEHVDDLGAGGFVRGDLLALAAEFGRAAEHDPASSPIGLARYRVRTCPSDEADALASELARLTADSGYVLWAPWVAREAVRRGPSPRAAECIVEFAREVEGPLVAAMADHAAGVVAGELDRVESAARTFLEHRCVMPAVDAGFDAVTLALEFGPSAPLRRALLEFSRVLELVTPHPPPRLAQRHDELIEAADMPSSRQLEIAALAAGGAASKEIAASLHLSARTVDNHLAAVYRSLDVSGREELAELGLA